MPLIFPRALVHRLEPSAQDSYETEIARLARATPEVLEIQQKSGLDKEDMAASMAQLKLLREKVEEARDEHTPKFSCPSVVPTPRQPTLTFILTSVSDKNEKYWQTKNCA